MNKKELYGLFRDMGLEVLQDEPMKRHTSFEIGGPVDIMLIPRSIDEILESIRFCRDRGIEYFIMGNGSNLLVRDTGIRGVVIKIGNGFDSVERRGDRLYCESGISLSTLAKFALEESLTGLEFASGIPGTIGGAITMNAGAYDGEMKDIVSKVVVLDGDNDVLEIDGEDMGFRYRGSRVIDEGLIVLGVELELREDEYSIIKDTMEDLNRRRATKQPQEFASGGSTFKRPTGYYAGKLIDDAGLRGLRHGDAQVSEKHCGFIVNRGNATFEDVMNLIGTVQKVVRDKFDVTLETEIRIVGD